MPPVTAHATCNARKITATAVGMWITRCLEFSTYPLHNNNPFLMKSDGRAESDRRAMWFTGIRHTETQGLSHHFIYYTKER